MLHLPIDLDSNPNHPISAAVDVVYRPLRGRWRSNSTGEIMIAYFKCLCGSNRQKTKQLQAEGYEIRLTNKSRVYRIEAQSYKARLPFKVTNGKVEEI